MKKRIASLLLSAALLTVCAGCRTTPASDPIDFDSSSTADADSAPAVTPAPPAESTGLLGELPVLYDTALTPSSGSSPECGEAGLCHAINAASDCRSSPRLSVCLFSSLSPGLSP